MTHQEALQKYSDWKFRLSAYEMALSIIGIDKLTVAPPDGAAYRDERSAFLSGEEFSIRTDPAAISVLEQLCGDEETDPDTRKEAETYLREIRKLTSIPKEDYVAFQRDSTLSYDAWLKARRENDYRIFEPHLRKMIDWKRKFIACRKLDLPVYDQMLDDYEPGMNQESYDRFFAALKERLIPLIREVSSRPAIREDFLVRPCPADLQKKWVTEVLLPYLRFDSSWGYQNETEHPFTGWTCENDCRTTTRYIEDHFTSAIFSTIHETGHAWYEHNIDPNYDGTILSTGVSSGMHESQSRFCENYLGRSLAFWQANYPSLQNTFPSQLGDVTLAQFVDAVNASKPSLIRTEADELTYPIHILIRYELEKGLFSGTIPTEGLEQTWADLYTEYLGITPKNAAEGILQDVHWSSGDFGYFPTYALGSAFAAQFFHRMKQDMDVDEALRSGRYLDCIHWLRDHIQKYGARYSADEVMKMATGEAFDPAYYIHYLEDKFSRLYHIG